MRFLVPALLICPWAAAQTWTQLPDFPGSARDDAASFTIGPNIYVGTGMDEGFNLTNDWYVFNTLTSEWSAIAPMPASGRQYCTAFNGEGYDFKGYVFGGVDATGPLNEMWRYDPQNDEWLELQPLPAPGRYACAAFSYVGDGYVCTGMLSDGVPTNEVWKFSLWNEHWQPCAPVPGPPRHRAADDGFMSIIGGADGTGQALSDVYHYNTGSNMWEQMPDLPAPRYSSVAASVTGWGGYGCLVVVGGATSQSEAHDDTWWYSVGPQDWTAYPIGPFQGGPRRGAVGSTVEFTDAPGVNSFFIGTGSDNVQRYHDWWLLQVPVGMMEQVNLQFSLAPVPADVVLHVSLPQPDGDLHISDLEGRTVFGVRISGNTITIPTASLASGTYVISLRNARGASSQRFTVLH